MPIKVGDRLPEVKFRVMTAEGPGWKTTADIFKGKKVALFAVPGAFTGTCHKMHVPSITQNADAIKAKGVDMDADLNKYDLEHAVTDHPTMSREELEAIYQEAWSIYYTPEHIETLLRRAIVTKIPLMSFIKVLVQFTTMMQVEKVHPLQSGLFRLKHIAERRPGLPPESVLAFYPRFLWSLVANNLKLVSTIWWMLKLKRRIERDPDRLRYMDQALTPVRDDDDETLDLLTKTEGGRAAVAHQKKIDGLTHAAVG